MSQIDAYFLAGEFTQEYEICHRQTRIFLQENLRSSIRYVMDKHVSSCRRRLLIIVRYVLDKYFLAEVVYRGV